LLLDEDEEDYDDEDIVYEPDVEGESTALSIRTHIRRIAQLTFLDDEDEDVRHIPHMPWEWEDDRRRFIHDHNRFHHPHRERFHHHPWGLFGMPGGGDERMVVPSYRSHRPGGAQRGNDDGANPLLQRQGRNGPSSSRRRSGEGFNDFMASMDPMRPGRFLAGPGGEGPVTLITNLLNMLSQGGVPPIPQGGTVHLHINGIPFGPQHLHQLTGGPGGLDMMIRSLSRPPWERRPETSASRPARDDPNSAASFVPAATATRWIEESRLLFGTTAVEKATLVINAILRLLVPPAREAQKRREEEAERVKKEREERQRLQKIKEEEERKAKEEQEAKEKKEREEREAAEAEEARAREQAAAQPETESHSQDAQAMEGVEQTQPEEAQQASSVPAEPAERVVTTIRGREVDITGLGIDPEFLEGIPEEMREEVLMAQFAQVRTQEAQASRTADAAATPATTIPPDFLEQLPPEMREELIQQEARERRTREREEARRRAAGAGTAPRAEEMDTASFFATLDPALRQSLLMDTDEDTLAALPPELAAEARALGADRHIRYPPDPMHLGRRNAIHHRLHGDAVVPEEQSARKSRPVVQILDKAGVATLLRLMFVPQQGSARVSLNGILRDVCANKQNRAEVVSTLLSILQDGSSDMGAVERSFAHLTLRAKQTSPQKTPQPKRASPEAAPGAGDMSPLMVVQQCLSTLAVLVSYNKSMADFFLKEHEMVSSMKSRSARKGKAKESKASKYPINALLGLLDRKLVIESAPVMEQLANLLQEITKPLTALQKREKEKAEEEDKKKKAEAAQQAGAATASTTTDGAPETADVDMTAAPQAEQPSTEQAATEQVDAAASPVEPRKLAEESKADDKPESPDEKPKKPRTLEAPPQVPEHNLQLVVSIVAARECSYKTFKDTLTLLTHLSTIPQAKQIFGKELIRQAQQLGGVILHELADLVVQINNAKSSTDVQGIALSRFSHSSSDQAKLLRVIKALDFLFDPKGTEATSATGGLEGLDSQAKEDILTTLYQNDVFTPLWGKLSEALTAIRQRGNMFNVATILLPLIEVLMVVCKNTTLKDAPLAKAMTREFSIQSPEPESKMESVFFDFTEEHRKILNDLVRHNPKLMSGSFSLLVKNSKVLEFDNKRNFFHRKLHSRGSELRQPHPSLQLSVRRDQVFLDSFKSLYYKKADEFKYGKLNIRFHGEEGVDAGGVTREWFQVLAKQMFDPNYALFNPVASDRTTFHPNPMSEVNPEHLTFFKFIGRVIGKALYENRVLDCHFSRAVYKRMLGKPVSIKDMETLDLDYYKSLVWMLENDITDIITETFSVESDEFGVTKIVDLMENGRNIPVTDENKHEYVRLVVEHKMIGSVKEQMEHFLTGKTIPIF
jgi:E3 ubiquitin-protein ligase HUWE1